MQHKLSDGTVLRTGSNRRFITFTISDDSTVIMRGEFRRTDDRNQARENHQRWAGRSGIRTVTIDFSPSGDVWNTDKSVVVFDTADTRR